MDQKMAKPTPKKTKLSNLKSNNDNPKSNKSTDHHPKVFDKDASIFIDMARDLKEEGNKLFQKRDYDGALVKYEKAIKLLPKNHIDLAYIHSNLAACYMQMGPDEYHKAIHECNLALEESPKYTKALLKRAKCFEALNRLELAKNDVDVVLSLEPNNLTALEISDKLKKALELKVKALSDKEVSLPTKSALIEERHKKKKTKKKGNKTMDKLVMEENPISISMKPNANKHVVEKSTMVKEETLKDVKLVFEEDIRFAHLPENCSIVQLREIVRNRFPGLKAILIKYKDMEGDLITITTSEELKWANESTDSKGLLRLYITEVKSKHEPLFNNDDDDDYESHDVQIYEKNINNVYCNMNLGNAHEHGNSCHINEWIVEFAHMFKNHVGIDSDLYLNLHQLGMKLYSEAMEDVVTCEEAMGIFEIASTKFQEMAALALFNCGNVHMSRAKKRLFLDESDSKDVELIQLKSTYEWAKGEYGKAKSSYEEAVKIKQDFYEGFFALALQQFEQSRLTWYFAMESMIRSDTIPSKEVLELFNNAEDNMERGTKIWEEMKEQHRKSCLIPNKEKEILEKMGLGQFFEQISNDNVVEFSSNMRSQLYILWGRILYERSIVEFKLNLGTWEECLMASVEKFKLAGASSTDITVMIKNHCANETTQEGLGFKIDEIVQAWNEMYDVKRLMNNVPSFRLEPLFRRRIHKLDHSLDFA